MFASGPVSRRTAIRILGATVGAVSLLACATPAPSVSPTSASSATAQPSGQAQQTAKPAANPVEDVPAWTPLNAGGQQPKPGGTLRMGIVGGLTGTIEAQEFAPSTADYVFAMFDKLVVRDANDQSVPQLAEKWDVSDDLKTHTFTLRKGVQFHSGHELTSDDIKFNIMRAGMPTIQFMHFFNFVKWWSAIDTPDKYTVVLRSDQPRPISGVLDFLDRLNIVDPQNYASDIAANTNAVGTGPYKQAEYVPGDHINLTKNPDYWQSGKPYLDGINVKFFADLQSLVTALEAGALDFAMNPPGRDVVRLESDPRFVHIRNKNSGLWYDTYANTTLPPLNNKYVRQALQFAMDRERWIQEGLGGLGTPRSLPWAPNSLAYDKARGNYFAFDLDKARSLIQQSGLSNVEFDFDYITNTFPEFADFAPIFQRDLASIGVKCNLKAVDGTVFAQITNLQNRTFGLASQGNCCTAMREGYILGLIGLAFNPAGNQPGFQDPQYASILSSLPTEPDESRRVALYQQLNDILLDQAFAVGLVGRTQDHLLSSKVHGVTYTMHESTDLTGVWLA